MDSDKMDCEDLQIDLHISDEESDDDVKSPAPAYEDAILADSDEYQDAEERPTIDCHSVWRNNLGEPDNGNRGSKSRNRNPPQGFEKSFGALTRERDLGTEASMTLDEICDKRGVRSAALSKTRKGKFHYDRDSEFLKRQRQNIDQSAKCLEQPAQAKDAMNRDETTPTKGRNRDDDYHQSGRNQQECRRRDDPQRNEKLVRGVNSIMEGGVRASKNDDDSSPFRSCWGSIIHLTKQGYEISWILYGLQRRYDSSENLKYRKYKSVITYKSVQGVCEAQEMSLAKEGAAADFLKKFKLMFAMGKDWKLSTDVNDVILIEPTIRDQLLDKLRVKYGGFLPQLNTEIGNPEFKSNVKYFTACFTFGEKKYEGKSIVNTHYARFAALRAAYEDLLGERCPMVPIFEGEAKATTPIHMYVGLRSERRTHVDCAKVEILEPGSVRQSGPKCIRPGRKVLTKVERTETSRKENP